MTHCKVCFTPKAHIGRRRAPRTARYRKVYGLDAQGRRTLLETVMRSAAVALVLIGAFGLTVSSYARDVSLGKHTAEEVKNVCEKVGGRFSQDATGHYCSTDCHGGPGTDCVVGCKIAEPCVAQVIGSRRPTNLGNALQAPPGSPR